MISSLGAGVIALSIFFLIAAIIFTIIRLRVRHSSPRNWFLDDYLTIAALVSWEHETKLYSPELNSSGVSNHLWGYGYSKSVW